MLMNKSACGFVLVDVQDKLTPHVIKSELLVSRCAWLLRLAAACRVPTLVCEQYPKGLGQTVSPLRDEMPDYSPIEKTHFSCCRNEDFSHQWQSIEKTQMVIAGIETHVCVLQTALDAIEQTGTEVFVIVDAVSSRHELDHQYGLARMSQAGVQLVTAEMLFFEWQRQAGTSEFKSLSQAFLKSP